MNTEILKEMDILWSSFDDFDVDQKLEAFERLKEAATIDDLPQLLELLKSDRNDFWTRELLSEPICELGGSLCLIPLFDALQINESEGHDNDGFCHHLTEVAWSEPEKCKQKLLSILKENDAKYKETVEWLLEFCE